MTSPVQDFVASPFVASLFVAATFVQAAGAQGVGGGAVGPFLDGAFPGLRPGTAPDASWSVQSALPNVSFREPVRVLQHPDEEHLLVASKDGDLWLVQDDPLATTKQLFLHLDLQYTPIGEGGIGGVVFHPDFGIPGDPQRGDVFVWYRWAPTPGSADYDTPGYSRLSRFTVPDGSSAADPASEEVLIQQYDREQFHLGGDLVFGLDGFLYVPVGDEGNSYPRIFSTQRLDLGLFGGVLRIDVDQDPTRSHPIRRQPTDFATPPVGWPSSFTQGYGIPDDNPWLDPGGSRLEEFYCIGLRHPWTLALDPATGFLWVGDVGQDQREELDLVELGANYQWPFREGTTDGILGRPGTVLGNERGPAWEYDHAQGMAVLTAGVYRGAAFPELYGRALAYDFLTGALWAVEPALGGGTPAVEHLAVLPSDWSGGLTSFTTTSDGRVLATRTAGGLAPGGSVVELVRSGTPGPEPPALLSEVGFFADLSTLAPHPAAHAYEVASPLWSDGAVKRRWFVVPNDGVVDDPTERLATDPDDVWALPVGGVVVKHFELALDESAPGATVRLETRFLVRATDGWYGVTYRWRADGSDADLLTSGADEVLTVRTPAGPRTQTWRYPSRLECLRCHTQLAGFVLGLKTGQLNRDVEVPGGTANQLEVFDALGLLEPPLAPGEPASLPRFAALDDPLASRADRVRSHLDANCAACHRPGGVRGDFDARFSTPLCEQGLLFGSVHDSLGVPGATVVSPGRPDRSLLLARVAAEGVDAMPPLARDLVDEAFEDLLLEWILSVDDEIVLGNDATEDAPSLDDYHPGLRILEGDVHVHADDEVGFVHPTGVRFHARALGNPVTPFVARRNGEDDFTILAIGDTRVAGEYTVGANEFPFRDQGVPNLAVAPGERLVAGFLDAYPDGSGWGDGAVIPAQAGPGEDEVWALYPTPRIPTTTPFDPARQTPLLVEGERPLATNAGLAVGRHTEIERSYRFAVVLRPGCAPSEPPAVGPLPPLGGDASTDGADLDAWTSNLVVLVGAGHRNVGDEPERLRVDEASFHARAAADPVTPFVARVDGPGTFTVLAIGTPRTTYALGENVVPFDDAGAPVVTLASGELLVAGYLDALPDGGGGGVGAVVPADLGAGELVWRTGGPAAGDSGSVAVGQPVQPGTWTITDERRDARFAVRLTREEPVALGADGPPGPGASPAAWTSNLVVDLGDVWTNASTFVRRVRVEHFAFFAASTGDPVTPFVALVEDGVPGVVLAVGTTRTSYAPGLNLVVFDDLGAPELDLLPGQVLAAGFLDAAPDGSGGGTSAPIPVEFAAGGPVWVTGGPTGSDAGTVSVGAPPTLGRVVVPDEDRAYPFAIAITATDWLAADCDGDGLADELEPDCDADGVPDDCEGASDCDGNGVPDDCDRAAGRLGSHTPYGLGTSGSGGHTPTLRVEGCLGVGTPFELVVERALGGTTAFLALSGFPLQVSVLGGTLLVTPPFYDFRALAIGGVGAGAGSSSVTVQFDGLAAVPGETFYLQAALFDPGAAGGVAFTQGLALAPPWTN